ncbi:unnamed protein product [Didymodactylos carnosus]|uniref:Uncharacterized protein n=1 Tax=Didymodactylos carnosus TaxID=1234261 RepID=A0A813NFD1_9BILA|nr:unnamed protein product [Didymodactylos carnosus]CAF0738380.1 unnamed protein product [Didymodactylos carnosus]CAF3515355.1 unnamed protein product [Didymodactylos carnosus]CAF3515436.1 unnamed protein product [Didymodactylos carnosus]
MARNSEKAMTALARWRQLQLKEQGKLRVDRRPHLASDETNVRRAEKWRYQVVREIAKKVAQIQNAGLGEYKIRDLNDEINKLLREKSHWEDRVKELGGEDFKKTAPKMLDNEGKEVPGNRGYKYFGAAKDLPGVRELFEQEPVPPPKKNRSELMRNVDADYYGYMDDDDGVLIPQEERCEKEAVRKKVDEWKARKEAILRGELQADIEKEDEMDNFIVPEMNSDDEDYVAHQTRPGVADVVSKDHIFIAHVPVPSQKEIERALLERKKQELLAKYNKTMFRRISPLFGIRFISHLKIPRTCSLHSSAHTDIGYFENVVKTLLDKRTQPISKDTTTDDNHGNKEQRKYYNKKQNKSYDQQKTPQYFPTKQKSIPSLSSKFTSNNKMYANKRDDQNKQQYGKEWANDNYVTNKSRTSTYNKKKRINQKNDNDNDDIDRIQTSKFNAKEINRQFHVKEEKSDRFENKKNDLTSTEVETKVSLNTTISTSVNRSKELDIVFSNKQDEEEYKESIPLEVLVQPNLRHLYTDEQKLHELIEQYIREMRPVLRPFTFDLAYLINESETLKRFVEMGVDVYRWNKPHAKTKYVLTLDFERDCLKHIIFLHDMGIQDNVLAQFLSYNPWIFNENIDDLKTRINYLESKQFKPNMIQHIISKEPYWLNLSTKMVDSKLCWFQKKFYLSADEIRTIVCKTPKLITLSLQDISNTHFNMKELLNFSEQHLKELLVKYPKLYQYDFKLIELNFDFLFNEMNMKHERLLEYPPVLKQSFQCLRSRCLYLKSIKRDQFDPSKPNFVSLKALCLDTHELFCTQVTKTSVKEYLEFCKTI